MTDATYLEWGKIFADLVKVALWPAAVIFIAIYYRDDVKSLATRLKRASFTEVAFDAPQVDIQQSSEPPAITSSAPQTASLQEMVLQIRASMPADVLSKRINEFNTLAPPEVQNDPVKKADLLLTLTASLAAQLQYERAYRLIFRSQIEFLQHLNAVGATSRSDAEKFYSSLAERFPEMYPNYSFERWIGFLVAFQLVSVNTHDSFEIEPDGRGLLRYLVDAKIFLNRDF